MGYWGVAMTKPNSEHIAKTNLERQGYITYLPKYLDRVGKTVKPKLLFPRYILVEIELQWHSITGTRGISRLLYGVDSKPAIVDRKIISQLKSREEKGYVTLNTQPKFRPGDRVAVASGVLEGYIGLYQGMKDQDRVKILIDLLGRKVIAEVAENDLIAAVAIENQGNQ